MEKISTSNTKAEIMAAYKQLVLEFRDKRSENTKLKKELQDKENLVERVSSTVQEPGSDTIGMLREKLVTSLNVIEDGMEAEKRKFEELQNAIVFQKNELQQLYDISVEAESLEAMLETNRVTEKKLHDDFEDSKSKLEASIALMKESWEKEEEEYQYMLKIKRRNEEDSYKSKKIERESMLTKKEIEFIEHEEEFKRLVDLEKTFASDMEQRLEQSKNEITEALTRDFDYATKLNSKEMEIQLKLFEQEIDLLKQKIKEQDEFIKILQSSSEASANQAKEIALKAIENSGLKSLNLHSDSKHLEKE